MKFEALSEEAKEVITGMLDYCLNHGIGMGQDEGIECFETNQKYGFRLEIERFLIANQKKE